MGETAGATFGESAGQTDRCEALMYGLTVVARNVRHYEPTGVAILNFFI